MSLSRPGLRNNSRKSAPPPDALRIEDGLVESSRLARSWSNSQPNISGPRGRRSPSPKHPQLLPTAVKNVLAQRIIDCWGVFFVAGGMLLWLAIATYDSADPSWNTAFTAGTRRFSGNWLGHTGAGLADFCQQFFGLAGYLVAFMPMLWGLAILTRRRFGGWLWRVPAAFGAMMLLAIGLGVLPSGWVGATHPGGALGTVTMSGIQNLTGPFFGHFTKPFVALIASVIGIGLMMLSSGLGLRRWIVATRQTVRGTSWLSLRMAGGVWSVLRLLSGLFRRRHQDPLDDAPGDTFDDPLSDVRQGQRRAPKRANGPTDDRDEDPYALLDDDNKPRAGLFTKLRGLAAKKAHEDDLFPSRGPVSDTDMQDHGSDHGDNSATGPMLRLNRHKPAAKIEGLPPTTTTATTTATTTGPAATAAKTAAIPTAAKTTPPVTEAPKPRKTITPPPVDDNLLALSVSGEYTLPPLGILYMPGPQEQALTQSPDALHSNAQMLESVLNDFGVNGAIVKIRPGPVVTLYELEPAPGTKSSRVIGLADDIARSMSAISARVAVVPGRNVIGIELPNERRQTVWLRELLSADAYTKTQSRLALVLGKDIGGEPIIADLARMPHLLVAGTTGSGKSVAVNTMILSLLYRLTPEQCRFIMIDPKMLELSIYADIPHLLTPVVTEPKKAVVALKWTVREMEDRYRAMSKMGVRNIDGYNNRVVEARKKGEHLTRKVQTGFDPETGKPVFEEEPIDLRELPYIVVIVDEFADLMLVAGKEIEGCIQRLAQMARAAGIHLIMATQRPSVDVITGTIKANFPTRISFAVTSKIDSRTILGEQGAEQLLGQGDMLYMAAGGRVTRVHGPFVKDDEVEAAVSFLKTQGEPDYIDSVTVDKDGDEGGDFTSEGGDEDSGSGDGLFDRAVDLVARERKASTSFIQRHLQIGYNRAARIIDQMEKQGMVSSANHVGKREVLLPEVD